VVSKVFPIWEVYFELIAFRKRLLICWMHNMLRCLQYLFLE